MTTDTNATPTKTSFDRLAEKAWVDKALGFKAFGVVFGVFVFIRILAGVGDIAFSILNIVCITLLDNWLLLLIIIVMIAAVIWILWRRSTPREPIITKVN